MSEVLAFDIGGTNLRVARVDDDYNIYDLYSENISQLEFKAIYERVVGLATEFIGRNGSISSIGLSLAGHVDVQKGSVAYHAVKNAKGNANGWKYETINIVSKLIEATGLPCAIENDGNAVALAEWKVGAGIGADSLVSFNLGTFAGSGVVLNGQIIRRKTSGLALGAALTETSDGKFDFVNMPISGVGFSRALNQHCLDYPESSLAQEVDWSISPGEYVFTMANRGDHDAIEIYRRAGKSLGILIASAINILDPEVVTLGGRMMDAEKYLLPAAMQVVHEHCLPSAHGETKIVKAKFQTEGGLVGAAVAAGI